MKVYYDKEQHKNVYSCVKKSQQNDEEEEEQKQIQEMEVDWKLFWTKYYHICPHLSIVALCLLSIGISEACVERSFSIQKLTHSDTRNRMKEDIVEAEMRLRFNKQNIADEDADEILRAKHYHQQDESDDELSDVEDAPIAMSQNDVEMSFS